ncbi:LysR family transcriptional regulator [Sinorhizobium mexicanum]|uniref:LysR family transcriptional regulator n=1 Tax=Sinorhizobium mexicanum TaxID=375549 RepID=A0A859QMT1_9HYPH|nr:LysR family transcriptional regulator [Sinorhizobium mexicanum]MBP1886426.1 DNA-binding transcriptional LysR family regulator [Sinorhizobium mexicanum]QLL63990.1 LysR family transcriptional regulator [Sinorhizobium mexicanum]
MRFDLTDLRLFLAVVDAGSITHGASDVGLSLPAASERLRDMEIDGEVKLLERGRRGVVPTEAGEALAHHARTIMHQMSQMRDEIGHYAKGLRANVRVLANTAATAEILPIRLAPWLAARPHVDVELRERESAEIARSISAGFAEIGILSSAVETGSLILRPFAIDRLVVVAARDHPLSQTPRIRFADALEYHFISLIGGALQDHIDAQAAKLGTKLKSRISLRSFDGICRMAGEGVGIGLVPETAARRYKRVTQIGILPLQDAWATRRLSICARSEKELTPLALDLFQHLAAEEQPEDR